MAQSNVSEGRIENRRPWDVVERESADAPPNELRYSSTLRLAALALLLSVAAIALMVLAVDRQTDFYDYVEHTANAGFPQVPPAVMTEEQRGDFISKWDISCADMIDGISHCQYVDIFSAQRLDYEDEYGLLFIGFFAVMFTVLFLLAIAFSRALNNLYALGFEMAYIPPAWAFIGFFIPLLSMFIPWLVVSRVWKAAWVNNGGVAIVVSAAWGILAVVTAILNPWAMGWIMRRSDIDGWLRHLQWVSYGLVWVTIAAIITSVILLIVAVRQRERYRALEATARA